MELIEAATKQPSMKDVIRHLTQLRDQLAYAIKADGLNVARFNDAQKQIRELDQQLTALGVPPMDLAPAKRDGAMGTRNQRRAAKRSQGNTLTQRMNCK
jgi:hypothetical protein